MARNWNCRTRVLGSSWEGELNWGPEGESLCVGHEVWQAVLLMREELDTQRGHFYETMTWKTYMIGTSLDVQWLNFCLPKDRFDLGSGSIPGEAYGLRSHMPHSQKSKTYNRRTIVTNSIKTLKWSTSKKRKKTKKTPNYVKVVRDTPELTSTRCTNRKQACWADCSSLDSVRKWHGASTAEVVIMGKNQGVLKQLYKLSTECFCGHCGNYKT